MSPEQIFLEHFPYVFRLARKILKSADDAEDVAQEVMLTVCKKLQTFRGDSNIKTWLHRVTVNAALRHLRKRNLHDHREVACEILEELEIHREESNTDTDYRWLYRLINQLPDLYRKILLADLCGWSNHGIGALMGLTEAAVKSRLHRARGMLAERLRGEYTLV